MKPTPYISISNKDRPKVLEAFSRILLEEKRIADASELAQLTGLSPSQVAQVLSEPPPRKVPEVLRHLTERVLAALFSKAVEGHTPSQKLWIQLLEQWMPGQEQEEKIAPPVYIEIVSATSSPVSDNQNNS